MDLPNAPFLKKIESKINGTKGRYADEIKMKNEKIFDERNKIWSWSFIIDNDMILDKIYFNMILILDKINENRTVTLHITDSTKKYMTDNSYY